MGLQVVLGSGRSGLERSWGVKGRNLPRVLGYGFGSSDTGQANDDALRTLIQKYTNIQIIDVSPDTDISQDCRTPLLSMNNLGSPVNLHTRPKSGEAEDFRRICGPQNETLRRWLAARLITLSCVASQTKTSIGMLLGAKLWPPWPLKASICFRATTVVCHW